MLMILFQKKAGWVERGEGVFLGEGGEVKDTYWQLHSLNRCCPASNK